jgi:hypothetical protein
MRILSLLIVPIILLFFPSRQTDSPHGADFKISCSNCHSSKGWQFDKSVYSFDHSTTKLPLAGQHKEVSCRQCHPTLVFSEAKTECITCHKDVHQGTTGADCSRCHTTSSWLVNNISEIHRTSRFPLVGAHRTADCLQCHKSESLARYDVPGINCIDCHRETYLATTDPNHLEAGLSVECMNCHPSNSFQWGGAGFNHNFFPLVQGHASPKCSDCHTTGLYKDAKPDCFSCHEKEYMGALNPDHNASGFTKTCTECHSLNPGWKPANFDHNFFSLTLGHANAKCTDCHIGGVYKSTPVACNSCHQKDYVATTNPDHNASGFSVTCTDCHTTNPGWKPTTFNHTRFPLTLGHAVPTCADCHKGNYSTISADCYSCHQADYSKTINPNHQTLIFSTTCTLCHSTNPGWKPATFTQHDAQFPIYSGRHQGQWTTCVDCHTNSSNYGVFTCITCHAHNKPDMDNKHIGEVSGYSYNSSECFRCHPRGNTN